MYFLATEGSIGNNRDGIDTSDYRSAAMLFYLQLLPSMPDFWDSMAFGHRIPCTLDGRASTSLSPSRRHDYPSSSVNQRTR